MGRKEKLLARARNNPPGVRYADLRMLAETVGFVFVRQRGSHRQYCHPLTSDGLNVQPRGAGTAKDWQVRAFLTLVDERGLSIEEDEE